MVCSVHHGLVEDVGFLHVACPSCIHLRCTMRFVEDTATRDGANGVTCPHPALHLEHRDILLLPIFEGDS